MENQNGYGTFIINTVNKAVNINVSGTKEFMDKSLDKLLNFSQQQLGVSTTQSEPAQVEPAQMLSQEVDLDDVDNTVIKKITSENDEASKEKTPKRAIASRSTSYKLADTSGLIDKVTGKSVNEKTRNIALLILKSKRKVSGKELAQICKTHNAYHMNSFSTMLTKSALFDRTGGRTNWELTLSKKGQAEADALYKKLMGESETVVAEENVEISEGEQ